jgi:lipopolysaccharide export LptBFGC system permease protein LptF
MCVIAGVEVVARPLHLEARLLRMYETARTGNPLKGSGFWMRTENTIVNIAALETPTHPGGIRIYEFDANGWLSRYEAAASADVRGNRRWQLNDVVTKTYAGAAPTSIERVAHEDWTPVWALATDIYSLPVASLSVKDLARRVSAGEGHEGESRELWRRLVLPLSAIAYAALAVAFALGAPLRGGKAVRMAAGIAVALLIYIAEQLVDSAGIVLAHLPIGLVLPVPSLLVLALAAMLLRRAP